MLRQVVNQQTQQATTLIDPGGGDGLTSLRPVRCWESDQANCPRCVRLA